MTKKDDPKNARQIINGNDKDDEIAAYHQQFLQAIKEATLPEWPEPVPAPAKVANVQITASEGVAVMITVNGETR